MIHAGRYISGLPREAILAHFIINNEGGSDTNSMNTNHDSGGDALFRPEEFDIYCNKVTLETYIFHGKAIDYETIDHLEYDHADYSVTVVHKDGTRLDLGAKIQWLVRPYFSKAQEVFIVQTKDGDSINGTVTRMVHKNKA